MPFQAQVKALAGSRYEVWTDAPQRFINEIGLEIYRSWVAFALGSSSLGIKPILNPTGKYARSISMKSGPNKVAIIQDTSESGAPWGQWIEEGHGEYDFKTDFRGRTFPMHRPGGTPFLKGKKVPGYTLTATRSGDFAGYATVGSEGWVIPAMQAYHPAMTLAGMAADKLRGL